MVKIKRYAVTLALVLLVAASLGTYYAYGANRHLPEYRLQTLEGDPAEAAALSVDGSYVGGKGAYSFRVTTEGSYGNGSLWHRLLSSGSTWMRSNYSDIDALFREHKQFMRGKANSDGFYRDDAWLFYVDLKVEQPGRHLVWKFDELRLEDGKRIRHEVEETEPLGKSNYANVMDVQRIGGEVHVLTYLAWLDAPAEYRDEVFDIATGKAVRSVKLDRAATAAPSGGESFAVVADATPATAQPQALLVVEKHSPRTAEPGQNGAVADAVPNDQLPHIDRSLYVYSYETGELRELPVPFKQDDSNPLPGPGFLLEGQTLVSWLQTDDAVTVTHYDLADGRAAPAVKIRADQIGKGKIYSALYENDRVYLLVRTDGMTDLPIVAVADAADGRILYKGQPVCVDPNGRPADQVGDVWLGNLSLRP